MGPVHWDDAPEKCFALDPMRGRASHLGEFAGSVEVGVGRWRPEPGCQTTPAHVEGGEAEIAFVGGGSGWSRIDGSTYEVAPGDCVAHRAEGGPHTLVAGDDGPEVLTFGERTWRGPRSREVAAGPVPLGPVCERPARIVAVGD